MRTCEFNEVSEVTDVGGRCQHRQPPIEVIEVSEVKIKIPQ
jgi:hypothetical protein